MGGVQTPSVTAAAAAPAAAKPKAKAKAKVKAPPVPLAEQAAMGLYAPAVVAGAALIGDDMIKKARGKGIGLHSKAINAFCERFEIPAKKRQGFIKTAKNVGHDLGMLLPGGHFTEGMFGKQAMQWWKDMGVDRW